MSSGSAQQKVKTNEGTAEVEESLMDVCPALVADGEPPKALEPGESALNDLAVSPEPFVALNASLGYAWGDAAAPQEQATAWEVIALVRV